MIDWRDETEGRRIPKDHVSVNQFIALLTAEQAEYTEMTELKFEDESYRIRGAVFEVYREMGCGFLEAVYQECLEKEFAKQEIPFIAQRELVLHYKGERLIQTYKPDFVCYDRIILELKAVKELGNEHRAQVHNYLKTTGLELGLLVNFGHYPKAEIDRIVR